jgi:hypothetical protein
MVAAGGGTVKDAAKGLPAAAATGGASILGRIVTAVPYVAAGAVTAAALWDMHQNIVDNGMMGMPLNDRLKKTGGFPTINGAYRRAFLQDRLGSTPEVSPTMTYGTGVGGDKSVSVSGTVTGEGKIVLDINAGSSLIDVAKRAEAAIKLSGSINSNGAGSLGHSSPDAAAPAAAAAPQAPMSP